LTEKFQFQLRLQLTEISEFNYEFRLGLFIISNYHCWADGQTDGRGTTLNESRTITIRSLKMRM